MSFGVDTRQNVLYTIYIGYFLRAGELVKMKKALLSLLVFPAMVNGVVAMEDEGLAKTDNNIADRGQFDLSNSANLEKLYFQHWKRNYDHNNIIENLGLDEEEYSESIENIKQLGLSAISHSINGVETELSVDELVEPFRDILITTGQGEKEDVIDYLDRLSISNYNYVVLENLLYMIAEKEVQSNTQELLDLIQVKIIQRTEQAATATADSIMQKLAKSIEDVEAYVNAGAVDMFITQFLDNTEYKINKQNALFYNIDDIQIQKPYKLDESLAIKMLEEKRNAQRNNDVIEFELEEKETEGNDTNSFRLFNDGD